jgi:hypothetical protein
MAASSKATPESGRAKDDAKYSLPHFAASRPRTKNKLRDFRNWLSQLNTPSSMWVQEDSVVGHLLIDRDPHVRTAFLEVFASPSTGLGVRPISYRDLPPVKKPRLRVCGLGRGDGSLGQNKLLTE